MMTITNPSRVAAQLTDCTSTLTALGKFIARRRPGGAWMLTGPGRFHGGEARIYATADLAAAITAGQHTAAGRAPRF
jgi:hypothetical protein